MSTKAVPIRALRDLVRDGDTVALGGAWLSNRPMAAVRELVRAGRRNLHAVSVVGSIDVDLLVAAGAVDRLTFSMVSLEAFGLAPNFRRAAEAGTLQLTEMTGLSLEIGIEAAARGLPWLPYLGLGRPPASELVEINPGTFGEVRCPFSGEILPVVKACKPDVAIVHVQRCDEHGNGQVDGTFGLDQELVAAASRVIVTCEELVPRRVVTASPHMTTIPGFLVTAVIEAPFGAHPTSHVPLYSLDGMAMLEYTSVAASDDFPAYLGQLRAEDEADYRARNVNPQRARVLNALVHAASPLVG